MALPKAYLTSTKNLKDILSSIQQAQAPKQFSIMFLNNLGFKSSTDRLVVGVLKSLNFLTANGAPTQRYFEFLDQTQSARILAEGIRDAYSDLFELNVRADKWSREEVKNKLKTLAMGQFSDDVLGKMAGTFTALVAEADFEAVEPADVPADLESEAVDAPGRDQRPDGNGPPPATPPTRGPVGFGGLVYNIQIQLPDSRDPAVYDALFRSLRTHLFNE
jgi:hypothetical protein